MAEFNPTCVRVLTERPLGKGGFGTVYLGVHQATGEQVAVKTFEGAYAVGRNRGSIGQELAILENLQHRNIVALRGHHVDVEERRAYLYLEYVSGGSLAKVLDNAGGRLFEGLIRRLTRDAALGLQYLHEEGVVHRDVKPQNLLISSDGCVKVTDFGCCKERFDVGGGTTNNLTSPRYMAPEAIRGVVCTASDVWGLAATVVHLASGQVPWSEFAGDIPVLFNIGLGKSTPAIPDTLSPAAVEALTKCFDQDADARYTCKALLETPFLKDVAVPLDGAETMEAYHEARESTLPSSVTALTMHTISCNTGATALSWATSVGASTAYSAVPDLPEEVDSAPAPVRQPVSPIATGEAAPRAILPPVTPVPTAMPQPRGGAVKPPPPPPYPPPPPPPPATVELTIGNTVGATDPNAQRFPWTAYVDDPACVVSHVTFKLHQTFKPSTITVRERPFVLSRRGWGEFTITLTVAFWDGQERTFYHDLNLSEDVAATYSLADVVPNAPVEGAT
eukprot:TRINITY_DN938_c1_g1_i1.p1 TRINITY_DN938_c1_g1~~TRINITY_DN938_c1_g1_i1.p1  ORF type:complete len:506 (+),score=140.80 TRINITY_DN938_c1_g1_i1:128-1645(+)